MQAAYETFGCNEGNVFFLGIDKGSFNVDVMLFDSTYGVHYPGVSGMEGNGNAVHLMYNILSTPTIVVITPDKLIATSQIWPPIAASVVDSVSAAGGLVQECLTPVSENSISQKIIAVSPNPVKDIAALFIQPGNKRELEIIVRNAVGQKVASIGPSPFEARKRRQQINLSGQPRGIYLVQVLENGRIVQTEKIILLH